MNGHNQSLTKCVSFFAYYSHKESSTIKIAQYRNILFSISRKLASYAFFSGFLSSERKLLHLILVHSHMLEIIRNYEVLKIWKYSLKTDFEVIATKWLQKIVPKKNFTPYFTETISESGHGKFLEIWNFSKNLFVDDLIFFYGEV